MRSIHPRCLPLLFAIGVSATLHAQERFVRSGNKAYSSLAYKRATEHYERAALEGAPTAPFARNLADSYDRLHDPVNAARWYGVVVQLPDVRDADLYAYSRSLRAIGDYPGADEWLARYQARAATDSRITRQQDAAGFAQRSSNGAASGPVVQNLSINTAGNEMGPSYQRDQLVFASDRRPDGAEERVHAWNASPFLDLFTATRQADGALAAPRPLEDLNSKYHESNATFSADGRTVYFTRNDHHKGRTGQDDRGVVNLRIYQRTFVNGAWTGEQPFVHNSDHWSVGHPCLSPQGDRLYFVSNMPGGAGGTDIWYCERTDAGWGEARNLGSVVNTEGNELFPSIDPQGLLSFASDGHQGLGGLDILICPLNNEEAIAPHNPGAPLNSMRDDFALTLDATGTTGYFTSDREGGLGGDDLYSIRLTQPLYPEESTRTEPLVAKEADTEAIGPEGDASTSAEDTQHTWEPSRSGAAQAEQDRSGDRGGDRTSAGRSDPTGPQIGDVRGAGPTVGAITEPDGSAPSADDAATRRLGPVHFAFSKWTVDPGMALGLEEVVTLLKQEPGLMVLVQGHTDSRGSAQVNLMLSRRRAKSCADHLIAKGIPAARVKWEGLGETQPVNGCTDGSSCDEAEHRANRRTEFIIRPL